MVEEGLQERGASFLVTVSKCHFSAFRYHRAIKYCNFIPKTFSAAWLVVELSHVRA